MQLHTEFTKLFWIAKLKNNFTVMATYSPEKIKSSLKKYNLSGVNKAKKTPSHPTKSHIVLAKEGSQMKLLRFGQQGVKGSPKKAGESKAYAARRKSFQARHAKNIAKGRMSAAFWSSTIKWVWVLLFQVV